MFYCRLLLLFLTAVYFAAVWAFVSLRISILPFDVLHTLLRLLEPRWLAVVVNINGKVLWRSRLHICQVTSHLNILILAQKVLSNNPSYCRKWILSWTLCTYLNANSFVRLFTSVLLFIFATNILAPRSVSLRSHVSAPSSPC